MSAPALHRTRAGAPTGSFTITASFITSTSVTLQWEEPDSANGRVMYQLLSYTFNDTDLTTHFKNVVALQRTIDNLMPYMNYTFIIKACTGIKEGCLVGTPLSVLTKMALPQGQMAPFITAQSPEELLVKWSPPARPNGKYLNINREIILICFFIHSKEHVFQSSV